MMADLLNLFLPAALSVLLPETLWGFSMFQSRWKRLVIPNAVLILALTFAGQAIIWKNSQGFLPMSFFACAALPLVALVTYLFSMAVLKRLKLRYPAETDRYNWFRFGTITIVTLPLLVMVLAALFASMLCQAGVIACTPFP